MHLSCFHLPAEQPRGDECSLLRRKWSKTWLWEAISGTAIFCHPSRRVTCVHPLLEVYSGLHLAACSGASCHLHTFVFSVYVCLVFNNSSMPAQATRRSPSHSAGSIIRVPSATFNISHPSVLLGDTSSTEGFVKFYTFLFYLILWTSYWCQIYASCPMLLFALLLVLISDLFMGSLG